MITESTIILSVIGMLGLFTSALVYQRSVRITSRYYKDMDTHKGIGLGNVYIGKSYVE